MLDIKQGHFKEEELTIILAKSKNGKTAGLDKIPSKVWETSKFDDILLWICILYFVYKQNTKEQWAKDFMYLV